MRRMLLIITLLFVVVGGYLVVSGIIFRPFLPTSPVAIGGVHIALNGDIVLSDVSYGTNIKISKVEVDLRWRSLFRRKVVVNQVTAKMKEGLVTGKGFYDLKSRAFDFEAKGQLAVEAPKFKLTPKVNAHARSDGNEIEVEAHASIANELGFSDAQVSWIGDTKEGDFKFSGHMQNGAKFFGNGQGKIREDGFTWVWRTLKAVTPRGQEWAAARGGFVDVSTSGVVRVEGLRVGDAQAFVRLERLSYGIKDKNIFLSVFAEEFPVPIGSTVPVTGKLSGELLVNGPFARPEGRFHLKITSGSYKTIPFAVWTRGVIEDSLIKIENAEMTGAENQPPVLAHGVIPWSWIVPPVDDRVMDISLSVGPMDPAILLKKIENVEAKEGGFLRFAGNIGGQKRKIKTQGKLTVTLPYIKAPSWGVDARDLSIDVEVTDKLLRVKNAQVKLGKGDLRLTGESELPELRLNLVGSQIAMKIRRVFDIKTDLNLELRGTLNAPQLGGKMHIYEGTYEAKIKKKEDGPEEEPRFLRFWEPLQVNVEADWQNNVWYRAGLTKIETQADLEVFKDHGQRVPSLRGKLTVLRGSYDAYGRDFVLKSGELTFTGTPEINPQVNLQATHKMKDATVELDVTGTALEPELHFRSTPPMPEQDILSMLALGKAPGHSGTDGYADPSSGKDLAADMMSNYLTRQVRSTGMNILDLDVIRVSPTEDGNEWTVGRYLGSKLFVSYSQNTEDTAGQVLKAEYMLTPTWTVVGQSGSQTDNYLDLNFRIPVGKR